jgi:hypothetical protein
MTTTGERFAQALASKDADALRAQLADTLDFQALTPGRHWQASTGTQAVEDIILRHWFGTDADIVELRSVTTGQVSDRQHVAYQLRVRRSGEDYVVEQQAYYDVDGPRITWMRLLCSGYRPVPAPGGLA